MLRKGKFFWELHGEDATGKPLLTSEGKPLIQSKEYTMLLSEKANLRRDLEAWRGKAFAEDELKGFDLKNVLGQFCMVNIAHREKGDMTYADLKGVSAVPSIYKKQGMPSGINSTLMFSLDKFDEQVFESLSDNIKETIRKSPEYRALQQPTTAAQYAATGGSVADMDNDIPF
jgi:hypothetical protein